MVLVMIIVVVVLVFVNNTHRLSSKARATIDKFREEAVSSTFTNPFL